MPKGPMMNNLLLLTYVMIPVSVAIAFKFVWENDSFLVMKSWYFLLKNRNDKSGNKISHVENDDEMEDSISYKLMKKISRKTSRDIWRAHIFSLVHSSQLSSTHSSLVHLSP